MVRSKSRGSSSQHNSMVESLEDRRLFAVGIAMPAANTLQFTGNAANDTLIINDNGAGVISGFRTVGAGALVAFGPVAGINVINVNMGAGNDAVRYTITADMWAGGARFINVDLGDGDDSFGFSASADIDFGPNAFVDLNVKAGLGKDYMGAFYRGEMDGQLRVNLFGDHGDDTLVTDVKFDIGSSGVFTANSRGGWGNDTIDLLVRKVNAADPIAINAWARGDGNIDHIKRTPLAFNDATCEFVVVVP